MLSRPRLTPLVPSLEPIFQGAVLALALLVWSGLAWSQSPDQDRVPAAGPTELIDILKRHVWPDIDLLTRMHAQRRLEMLGREAPITVVPLLVRELSAPRRYGKKASHQRLALIETLRDIGPAAEEAVPVLIEVLHDPEEWNDWVKMAARMALGQIGSPLAEQALSENKARQAEKHAATASAEDQRRAAQHSAFLIRQELRRPRPSDSMIAASLPGLKASGDLATVALPTLLRAYKDPRLTAGVRSALVETIAAMGIADVDRAAADAALPGEIDPFEDLLADVASSDDFISSMAMAELGKLGPSERAIEALTTALDQGHSPGAAANALGNYGEAAAASVPHLVPYFADDRVGGNAIQAIGKIGVTDARAVSELRRIVRGNGQANRGFAAKTLSLLGIQEALPDLQTALRDDRKYTRILAAAAIGRFGADAEPAVVDLGLRLGEADNDVRRAAIEALGKIGPAAQSAAPLIARDLEASDGRLRRAAEQALVRIGGPVAEQASEAKAEADLVSDRVAAQNLIAGSDYQGLANLLRTLPDRRSLALAEPLMAHSDPEVAFLAAAAHVERAADEQAIAQLIEIILAHERGPDLLTGVAWALMHSGDEARNQDTLGKLVAELNAQLKTASPKVRERFQSRMAPATLPQE